jgi:hypothetical protein
MPHVHWPLTHVSFTRQRLPQAPQFSSSFCVSRQAPAQHEPPAQAVPSGAFGLEQRPVAGSHVPATWHWSSAVQTTGSLPTQAPSWQVAVWLQALLSLQGRLLGFGGFEQRPVAGSQVPGSWHWSSAAHETGLAPIHAPPWQVAVWVQALLSLQAAPSGFAELVQPPVARSQTPGSWH